MFTGVNVRPIAEVVAGLDRAEARTALGREAFPIRMAAPSWSASPPASRRNTTACSIPCRQRHGRRRSGRPVLGDECVVDGLRPAEPRSLQPHRRRRLRQEHQHRQQRLKVIEAEAGGCSAKQVRRFFLSPTGFADLQRYGGKGYQLGMRATRDFVELAARGRTMPPAQRRLDANDNNALSTAFFSLMGERQVLDLIQAAAMSGVDEQQLRDQLASSVNLCQLGRTVLIKLEGLPSGTKARLFGTVSRATPAPSWAPATSASLRPRDLHRHDVPLELKPLRLWSRLGLDPRTFLQSREPRPLRQRTIPRVALACPRMTPFQAKKSPSNHEAGLTALPPSSAPPARHAPNGPLARSCRQRPTRYRCPGAGR